MKKLCLNSKTLEKKLFINLFRQEKKNLNKF